MSQNGIPSVNLADFLSEDPSRKQKFVNEIDACWKKMTDQLDIDTDGKYHDIIVRYMALRNVDRLFRFKLFTKFCFYS